MPLLTEWSTFYVAIGSSAAALTGLTFVVITIVGGQQRLRNNPMGLATFTTPTVIHFGAALLLSAVLLVPWHGVIAVAVAVGTAGLCGVIYCSRVMYLTSRLNIESYSPDTEDWAWYGILPFLAYGAILAGAAALPGFAAKGLFAVAGGTLLLIFIGIRNSWDVVTYLIVIHPTDDE